MRILSPPLGGASRRRLVWPGGETRGNLKLALSSSRRFLGNKVDPASELGQREIFGPVLGILRPAIENALEIANDVPFGLSAAIFTRTSTGCSFIKSAEAGMIKINGETAGVEPHAPFGGVKQSSSHSREQGRAAMILYFDSDYRYFSSGRDISRFFLIHENYQSFR